MSVKAHSLREDAVCLCGKKECAGLTAAFSVLGDARKRFVELPPRSSPDCTKQREAYLRHVLPKNKKKQKEPSSDYLALFHFHPEIVRDAFTQAPGKNQIPKTISFGKAVQLRMILSEKDKVQDDNGMPAFIYCPTYPLEKVKQDLEALTSDTKIQEQDSIDSIETIVDNREELQTTIVNIPIPSHIDVEEDTASEISSMTSILFVDEVREAMTLTTLVSAAITVQSFVRRCHAVEKLKQLKREHNALLTLQSAVRMYHVRKQLNLTSDYSKLRRAAVTSIHHGERAAMQRHHGVGACEGGLPSCDSEVLAIVPNQQERRDPFNIQRSSQCHERTDDGAPQPLYHNGAR